jgi:predicted nucleic acid-binding protein
LRFVLDNSISARWLLNDGSVTDLKYAFAVRDALLASEAVVPSLWGLELANVIAREERIGFPKSRTELFLAAIVSLNICLDVETHPRALKETLAIARAYNITPYDASYLEIAIRCSIEIASLDKDLLKAAKKAGVSRFEP